MRRLRPSRPSPAMAVALLALFVALGGSAVAASGQISRLINGTSIKRGTLPGDRLRRGTVKGDRIARRTLTGTQVNVARLGTVPKAKAADTAARATNAATAQNAVNASSVGGVATKRFLVKVATGGAATTVLSLGGVTLTGACPGGRPTLSANTAVDNAWMRGHFLTEATATGSADTKIVQSFGNSDFDTNETPTLVDNAITTGRRGDVLATYLRDGAPGVRIAMVVDDSGTLGSFAGCLFAGDATIG